MSEDRYKGIIPDGSTWVRVDEEGLRKLAEETVRSDRIMRSEPCVGFVSVAPGNSGFEQACGVLRSLAEHDEDVSDIIPDHFS